MRLFVGTFLGPSNQSFYDRFVAELVAAERRTLRPIPSHSAHLTCVFAADVPEAAIGALDDAVRHVAVRQRPFPIGLTAPHVLMAGRTPRLVCADMARGAADLLSLTDLLMHEISESCPGLDLRPTRSAHVTLARFRRHTTREDAERVNGVVRRPGGAEMERDERVSRLQVIESVLTSTAPAYAVRVDVPFGDRGA